MKLKFVMAKTASDHADRLHEVQRKLAKLNPEVRALETEERQLKAFLIKHGHGESFKFNSSDGYEKVLKVSHVEMFMLDQEAARKLLKKRTPYKDCSYDRVKVDWVYA